MSDHDPKTVLVVDDEAGIIDLIDLALGDDYRLLTAETGPTALEILDDSVDVVLLDRRMPDMRGFDVLDAIRARGFDVPVAVVTAVRPGVDIVEAGFDDYLIKPIGVEEIHACVERLLALDASDGVVREYAALLRTVAALESRLSASELHDTDEYTTLIERLDEFNEELDAHFVDMDDPRIERLLEDQSTERP